MIRAVSGRRVAACQDRAPETASADLDFPGVNRRRSRRLGAPVLIRLRRFSSLRLAGLDRPSHRVARPATLALAAHGRDYKDRLALFICLGKERQRLVPDRLPAHDGATLPKLPKKT